MAQVTFGPPRSLQEEVKTTKEIFKFGEGGRLPGIPGEGDSFFRE
jgi:hypothetical protein